MAKQVTQAGLSVVGECLALVAPAESAFLSRWRMTTLERLDKDLHDLLQEQRGLYDRACLMGTEAEAVEQSEAMVRGWRAAISRMEHGLQEDDAYLVGQDRKTGMIVCISDIKESIARAQKIHGDRCVFMTPDEVATLLAGTQMLAQIKSVFPDAEIVDIYPDAEA